MSSHNCSEGNKRTPFHKPFPYSNTDVFKIRFHTIHLRLGLASGCFLQVHPPPNFHVTLVSLIRTTCPSQLMLLYVIILILVALGEEYKSRCHMLLYFLTLGPTHFPQHPKSRTHSDYFLPLMWYDKNNSYIKQHKNYRSVIFNLCVLRLETGRLKILCRMVAEIPRI